MPISFPRAICCNFAETCAREWLLTNGVGGYASGTLSGVLTRLQHGFLVASLPGENVPHLLLAKIDEEVHFDQRTYYLGTNEYQDGTINPSGFVHLEAFRLEAGLPVFIYRLGSVGGVTLEKRIWMIQGENTTCIQYRVLRTITPQADVENVSWRGGRPGPPNYARFHSYSEATQPTLTLTLLPLVAYRPYDQPQYGGGDGRFQVLALEAGDEFAPLPPGMSGCTLRAQDSATPYHLLVSGDATSAPQFLSTGVWYWRFLRRDDQAAGLSACDDLYLPGVIRARLAPDQALTLIVTAEELRPERFDARRVKHLYEQTLDYQRGLLAPQRYFGEGGDAVHTLPVLPFTSSGPATIDTEEFLHLLHQAGDHCIALRTPPHPDQASPADFFFHRAEQIPAITTTYPSLSEQTREALIALPGLTISTHRFSEARKFLRALARYFRQGLLPEHLPTVQRPALANEEYRSVDTPLWYCYALDKYVSATHDYELLDELYPQLVECLDWYVRGTAYGIQVDPGDGLLRTGAPEVALTWMNACSQGQPLTPRSGKAVEVNALWYHSLLLMQEWSHILRQRGRTGALSQRYEELHEQCQLSFNARFWYQDGGYLYDVIDGPGGHETCLRPNQLFSLALRHAVLDTGKQAAVLETVTRHLVTPYGLRTLAPDDPAYRGDAPERATDLPRVLHQGGAWPWLVGPYIDALLAVGLHTANTRHLRPELYKEYLWRKGLQLIEPFRQQMQERLLGHIGNVYAGDAPHPGLDQLTSALSAGEILRAYKVLAHLGVQQNVQSISVEM